MTYIKMVILLTKVSGILNFGFTSTVTLPFLELSSDTLSFGYICNKSYMV